MELTSTEPNPDAGATNSAPKSFGYNLMKKMGWTDGKGLGLNEDGETDHIKVRRKRSNAGLGASKETQSSVANGLNDVLAKLATSNTCVVSQETKPKIDTKVQNQQPRRKQRAFLARRAAGKDVSSYSREQLKEILGGVLPQVEKEETKSESEIEEKDDNVVEVKEGKKLKKKKDKQKDTKIKVDSKIKKSKKSKKEKKSKDKRKKKSEES